MVTGATVNVRNLDTNISRSLTTGGDGRFRPGPSPWAYFAGREPVIRMSTSLLALGCQLGLEAT